MHTMTPAHLYTHHLLLPHTIPALKVSTPGSIVIHHHHTYITTQNISTTHLGSWQDGFRSVCRLNSRRDQRGHPGSWRSSPSPPPECQCTPPHHPPQDPANCGGQNMVTRLSLRQQRLPHEAHSKTVIVAASSNEPPGQLDSTCTVYSKHT